MALTDQLRRSGPYLERLLEDDYLHERLVDAGRHGRDAYARVTQRSARQMINDQRLHRSLRDGAASARDAVLAIQGTRRQHRRRRGTGLLALTVATGAAGIVVKRRAHSESEGYRPPAQTAASGAVAGEPAPAA